MGTIIDKLEGILERGEATSLERFNKDMDEVGDDCIDLVIEMYGEEDGLVMARLEGIRLVSEDLRFAKLAFDAKVDPSDEKCMKYLAYSLVCAANAETDLECARIMLASTNIMKQINSDIVTVVKK
jgi:hypothetical protein